MKVCVWAAKAALGVAVTIGTVACGENGSSLLPTGPTATLSESLAQSSGGQFSGLDASRVPAINVPDGVSCPNDPPIVYVSGVGTRVDIEWSAIPKVTGYEIAIERYDVSNAWVTAHIAKVEGVRYEWYGDLDSRYRVRVRSIRCGGTGMWSAYHGQTLDAPPSVPPSQQSDPPVDDEDDDEEEPCEEENPYWYYARNRSPWQAQTTLPCGFSWGDEN